MSYALIDAQIQVWASAHALTLFTSQGTCEIRCAYVSSTTGECFQIWIDPVRDNRTCVYADCVEGRKENDEPARWSVSASEVAAALNIALQTVYEWMAPSERDRSGRPH